MSQRWLNVMWVFAPIAALALIFNVNRVPQWAEDNWDSLAGNWQIAELDNARWPLGDEDSFVNRAWETLKGCGCGWSIVRN